MIKRAKDLQIGDVFLIHGVKQRVVGKSMEEIVYFPVCMTVRNDCQTRGRHTFGTKCMQMVELVIDQRR